MLHLFISAEFLDLEVEYVEIKRMSAILHGIRYISGEQWLPAPSTVGQLLESADMTTVTAETIMIKRHVLWSFLKTSRTLIDVYEGEITLRVDNEAVTFNFTLEEIDAFLYDKSISLESDHDDCDLEEDIYVLEQLLNDDPFQLPPMDLKQSEVTEAKSSIEEPPELELKDLPSNLEYAFFNSKRFKK
ncbi:hypothetical protein Tco_1295022 [Tanacetum coccineum]